MPSRSNSFGLVIRLLSLAFCLAGYVPAWATLPSYTSEDHAFQLEPVVEGEDVIWGFDFLAKDQLIYSTRNGALKILNLSSRSVKSLKGVPQVWSKGQGGLLDVRVHPKDPSVVYFSYSQPAGSGATTALARAKIQGENLTEVVTLFSAVEANTNQIHFGSRIEFDGADHLFLSVGDRNDRPKVQDLNFHNGKVLRLNLDGTVPNDNPFVGKKGARPEIWSYGHRNPQGLVRNPQTGDLWEAEMGPRGGDELNLIRPGANYGWPIITFGREYIGGKIGEGTHKEGMEQPSAYWVPSISPSGIGFYTGKKFAKWSGNLFLGTLSGTHLRRVVLEGTKVTKQEVMLAKWGERIRNVRQGPDENLYLSTDSGRLVRLVPVEPSNPKAKSR